MRRTPSPTRPRGLDDLLDPALASRLARLDLASRKVFVGRLKGERRSKKRGESVEFADHRPYVVGDDLRHIDWNVYARLDRLFLKLFMEEEDLSLHLVIDASASSDCGEPGKFHFMQRFAMTLGAIGLVNLNRVACTVLGGRARAGMDTPTDTPTDPAPTDAELMHSLRDLRGRRRMHDLARFLCSIEPAGDFDFRACAKRLALARRGKGVMVVLSDFFFDSGYEDGLRMLVGHGYDLVAVQVLSPQEIEPDVRGDLRLRDVESRGLAEVTISAPLLDRYKRTLDAYTDALHQFCARREITFLQVASDADVEELVTGTLRRKGVLR